MKDLKDLTLIEKLLITILLVLCVHSVAMAEVNVTPEGLVTTGKPPTHNTPEDFKIFKKISDETRPHILPAITGTIGVVGGIAAGVAAGSSVPMIIIGSTLSGAVYYVYGYGAGRLIDEFIIADIVKENNLNPDNLTDEEVIFIREEILRKAKLEIRTKGSRLNEDFKLWRRNSAIRFKEWKIS